MTPLPISHITLTTAVGAGMAAQVAALEQGRSGLRPEPFETCQLPCWTGQVAGLDTPLAGDLRRFDCRNHRLSELALQQDGFIAAAAALRERYGAARVGVFIGTSTAGVQQTELAYRARSGTDAALPDWFAYSETQNTYSVASYVQQRLQLTGIAVAISTACSSSAKVFASAARAIAAGQCDAAIVGGVDSLCLTTLYGFNALQLLTPEPCRPSDVRRSGISIGEAAGFAILDPNVVAPMPCSATARAATPTICPHPSHKAEVPPMPCAPP
jgi:3-oxoacyl-[acyl-carrier-protein] synthase-1